MLDPTCKASTLPFVNIALWSLVGRKSLDRRVPNSRRVAIFRQIARLPPFRLVAFESRLPGYSPAELRYKRE